MQSFLYFGNNIFEFWSHGEPEGVHVFTYLLLLLLLFIIYVLWRVEYLFFWV
jgi:hypothetical protein